MPDIAGEDGKKLSKRHGAQSLDEFRDTGYYAPALMNFLALLGWSYDDKTTIMSRDELIERFSFDRVQSSPAAFDYKKLDWMNGVYLRGLAPDAYADALIDYLARAGSTGTRRTCADRAARAGEARAPRRVSRAARTSTSRRRRAGGPVAARPGGDRHARATRSPSSSRGTRRRSRRRFAISRSELGLKPRPGVPADPDGRHGLEGLARACSRASSCSAARSRSARLAPRGRTQRPRRPERVERALELQPRPPAGTRRRASAAERAVVSSAGSRGTPPPRSGLHVVNANGPARSLRPEQDRARNGAGERRARRAARGRAAPRRAPARSRRRPRSRRTTCWRGRPGRRRLLDRRRLEPRPLEPERARSERGRATPRHSQTSGAAASAPPRASASAISAVSLARLGQRLRELIVHERPSRPAASRPLTSSAARWRSYWSPGRQFAILEQSS